MTGLIPVRGSVGTASTTIRKICAGALVCLLTATCGRSGAPSPVAPSESKAAATPAIAAGGSIFGAASADLARCLSGAADAACFSGARPIVRVTTAGATAPGAPGGLTATSSGSSVTLTWSTPASGDPVVAYIIEAGSAAGLANLANFSTGNATTTFSTGGVPNGTYYVRVRAQNAAGTSAASNEAILVVGSPTCTSAPNAPSNLTSAVSGTTVTLSWSAPSGGCLPTSYVLQAGSTPGSSNIANASTGSTATTYTATGVPIGSYYIRVRAQNLGGQSAASNEVTASVGGGSPITVTVNGPVTYSGQPTTSAGCGGIADTWYYTQTIQTSGIGVTLLNHWSDFDGRRTSDVPTSIAITARSSYAYSTVWCPSGSGASGAHTVQTTWTGNDANGTAFSYTGPSVTLVAKSGTSLQFNPTTELTVSQGQFYSISFQSAATGGHPPYHFQLDTLGGFPPIGLVLSPDGVLSGTATITGTSTFKVCVVDLDGTSACKSVTATVRPPITVSPTSFSIPASGGGGSVSVTAPAGTTWSAGSNSSFISVTGGASGSGNGTVTFSVSANTTGSLRTGSLTVAGQGVTVTQAGNTNPFDGSYRAVRTYSCTPQATCGDNVPLAGCSNSSFTFTVSNGIIQDSCQNFNPNTSIPSNGSFSTLFYGFLRISGTWGTGTFTLQGTTTNSSGTYTVSLTITKTS